MLKASGFAPASRTGGFQSIATEFAVGICAATADGGATASMSGTVTRAGWHTGTPALRDTANRINPRRIGHWRHWRYRRVDKRGSRQGRHCRHHRYLPGNLCRLHGRQRLHRACLPRSGVGKGGNGRDLCSRGRGSGRRWQRQLAVGGGNRRLLSFYDGYGNDDRRALRSGQLIDERYVVTRTWPLVRRGSRFLGFTFNGRRLDSNGSHQARVDEQIPVWRRDGAWPHGDGVDLDSRQIDLSGTVGVGRRQRKAKLDVVPGLAGGELGHARPAPGEAAPGAVPSCRNPRTKRQGRWR